MKIFHAIVTERRHCLIAIHTYTYIVLSKNPLYVGIEVIYYIYCYITEIGLKVNC